VAPSSGQRNEPSGSIKGGEFPAQEKMSSMKLLGCSDKEDEMFGT
jgi:hypothetical protein